MFEVEEDDACGDVGANHGPSGVVSNMEESDDNGGSGKSFHADSYPDDEDRINDASREQLIDSVQDMIQSTKREVEPKDSQA